MATRQVVLSDISGDELDDATHTTVVVEHPDIPSAVKLDVSADEANKLSDTTLRLVTMTIYAPNVSPRRVQMETKALDKLFSGVNFDKVLEGAPKAETRPAQSRRRPAGGSRRSDVTKDYNDDDLKAWAEANSVTLGRGRRKPDIVERYKNDQAAGRWPE